MPRPLRTQYEGALYHVTSRGDSREAIFLDERDRVEFLYTFGEACSKTGWQTHAYCLMTNHFHLVLETPQPNLATGMKWLFRDLQPTIQRATPALGASFWRPVLIWTIYFSRILALAAVKIGT